MRLANGRGAKVRQGTANQENMPFASPNRRRPPPLTSETVVASTWISAKSPQTSSATDGGEQEAGTARGILRASRHWQLECKSEPVILKAA